MERAWWTGSQRRSAAGSLPGGRVADEVRRAGAGHEGARRAAAEVEPARARVAEEVGGLDPPLLRHHRPHHASGERGGVPALARRDARQGSEPRARAGEQGPAGGVLCVEPHQCGAAVGDRGSTEPVPRGDAVATVGATGAETQEHHAVTTARPGGGVGEAGGAEGPGPADAGGWGRGAVEGGGAARGEVDERGHVGRSREVVLTDDEGMGVVEERVTDRRVGAGRDGPRVGLLEARAVTAGGERERPVAADGHLVAGRARDRLPPERVSGRSHDDGVVAAPAGGRRGRRHRRAARRAARRSGGGTAAGAARAAVAASDQGQGGGGQQRGAAGGAQETSCVHHTPRLCWKCSWLAR